MTLMLKDIFGFAKHQEKGTNGLDYRLILIRKNDRALLNKANENNNAKKINSIDWYVTNNTPSLWEENTLLKQIANKKPTELEYTERSVPMKDVNTQNLWTFELGTPEGINVPVWIFLCFQQSDRQHDRKLKNDALYGPPVTSAQCVIGSKKIDDDDYSQS